MARTSRSLFAPIREIDFEFRPFWPTGIHKDANGEPGRARYDTASDPRLERKQKVEGRKDGDGDGKEEDIVSSAARADHAAKTFCGRRSRMSEGRMELRRGGGVCLHLSICRSIRRPEYGFPLSLSPSCSGRRARA